MGRVGFGSEVFNCSAPDTGNMEVLARYGNAEQKERWLKPLLAGEIRSAFLMTEPAVASSDATNIETSIERDGDHYVINGRKWWSSGVGDPRCKIAIVMGKTDPGRAAPLAAVADPGAARHAGHRDRAHAAGVRLSTTRRTAMPRCVLDERARAGGEPAARRRPRLRDRAGPPRARAASTTACAPSASPRWRWRRWSSGCSRAWPSASASPSSRSGSERIADARIDIEMTRLLCLKAADMMDKVGNKVAQLEIAMIKVRRRAWRCRSSTTRSRPSAAPA